MVRSIYGRFWHPLLTSALPASRTAAMPTARSAASAISGIDPAARVKSEKYFVAAHWVPQAPAASGDGRQTCSKLVVYCFAERGYAERRQRPNERKQ
jgi:hypothetical protein